MKNKLIALGIFAASLCTLAACLPDEPNVSLTVNYCYGVFNTNFADNDSVLIKQYLATHDCPTYAVFEIEGDSYWTCDSICAQKMQQITQRISVAQLDSLPLSDSCRFDYAAARYAAPFSQNFDLYFVGTFSYKRGDSSIKNTVSSIKNTVSSIND